MKRRLLALFLCVSVTLFFGTILGCSSGQEEPKHGAENQHDEAQVAQEAHEHGEEHAEEVAGHAEEHAEEAQDHVEHHAEEGHEQGEHHGHHEAYHGGVLNVIGEEAGHIEIRLVEDTMDAWFVGGGNETNRSVPIKAEEVTLAVTIPGQDEQELVLRANPMKLAGEELGECSRFIAQADWLDGVEEFEAKGEIEFKGVNQALIIKYPHGYDPMHGHQEHGEK